MNAALRFLTHDARGRVLPDCAITTEDLIAMDDELGWMVVRTSGDEIAAYNKLRDKVYDPFLPAIWRGNKAVAMFPRYLFVREVVAWGPIQRLDEISYVLECNGRPGIVPHEKIKELDWQMVMGGGAVREDWWARGIQRPLKAGDPVRVIAGKHADRIGFVHMERSKRRHSRVAVMLDTKTGTRVEYLPEHYLAQLTAAPPAD